MEIAGIGVKLLQMAERKEIKEKHGVIFVIFDGKKIQLEKRSEEKDKYCGFTFIPGGKVEAGEAPLDALIREVKEEYCVTAEVFKQLGTISGVEAETGLPAFHHIFMVSKWGGNLSNPEDRNVHLEATIEEAREICQHPVSQKVIDLVEAELFGQNS